MHTEEEPVIIDGKLVGWYVTTPDEHISIETIGDHCSTAMQTRQSTKLFIPLEN